MRQRPKILELERNKTNSIKICGKYNEIFSKSLKKEHSHGWIKNWRYLN